MDMLVPSLAALIGVSATAAASAHGAGRSGASPSPAMRYGSGSAVAVTVRARIIRTAASVGAGFGPPTSRMVPRHTIVSAADGRPVPALIYDFE